MAKIGLWLAFRRRRLAVNFRGEFTNQWLDQCGLAQLIRHHMRTKIAPLEFIYRSINKGGGKKNYRKNWRSKLINAMGWPPAVVIVVRCDLLLLICKIYPHFSVIAS